MKRNILTIALLFVSTIVCFSQVETRYFSKGEALESVMLFKNQNISEITKSTKKYSIPKVDTKKLLEEDAMNNSSKGLYRFGKGVDIFCTLDDGQWHTVVGGRLWTMTFESQDARSLSFVFDSLILPDNSELYIVNQDESELYGPVKASELPETGTFLTDAIDGSNATLLLFEPDENYGKTVLSINSVVYGYRGPTLSDESKTRTVEDCGIDVVCYPEYDNESKGVARIMVYYGSNYYYGTGALLMSTNYLFRPYLMTAFHCIDIINADGVLSNEEKTNIGNYLFRFNFMKEECGGSLYKITRTFFGGTLKASIPSSDWVLIELNGNVRNYSNICWLGWDMSNSTPTSAVGIHHPHGEAMEISIRYNSITNSLWMVKFDEGATWKGSSGSPLFNQDKRVVGCLYSGTNEDQISPCISPTAWYSKFWSAWYGGGTDSTRLSNWLDPLGTGQTTIDSSFPNFDSFTIIGSGTLGTSNVYYVNGANSSMTVTWSLSDSYYDQNCLQQNTPTINQCKITRDYNHSMGTATLQAEVWDGNTLLKTLTKTINGSTGFYGTYYNGVTTKEINLPSTMPVLLGANVQVNSPLLIGASVSFTGNASPTSWSLNSTTGTLYFGVPSTGAPIIVVQVNAANGYIYHLPFIGTNNTEQLNISYAGEIMTIAINYNNESLKTDDENLLYRNDMEQEQDLRVKVTHATNGAVVYEQITRGQSVDLNTTGWSPGIYVVQVIIGDKILSKKVIVK